MRLIFVNRFFYPDHSATSQLLSDLCFELSGLGHEVKVVTSCQLYDDADAVLPSQERVNGVEVHRVRTSRFGRANLIGRAVDYATFYLAAGWLLWRIARMGDVIIAKTDPPLISVIAFFVARLRGARLINWVQDVFPEVAEALGVRALAGPQAMLLRSLRNAAFRAAAANVVLGERMAAVVEMGGASPSRIREIANWADMDAIRPLAHTDNALRHKWNLDDKLVVCYSGNMGRVHEFETMLGAPQRLRSNDDDTGGAKGIEFLFIGGGAQRRKVEDEVRSRGLSNIQFRPYQDRADLSLSLGIGDVHLVSQRPEVEGYVFPSKLYGILAAGRPVVFVGDPQGEISLLVEREGIGVAVRQGDARGLAEQLLRLAGDAALREAMGVRARELLCNRYDKRIAFKAWQDLLEGLA